MRRERTLETAVNSNDDVVSPFEVSVMSKEDDITGFLDVR
jgi:hypothetical protein